MGYTRIDQYPYIVPEMESRNVYSKYYVSQVYRALYNEIAFIIRSHQTQPDEGAGRGYRTVLDLALEDEVYGSQATMSEIVDQVKTFLFAGHDTSASMLVWSYYYLSSHPDCLAKIKKEHDDILGISTDPTSIAEKITADPKLIAKLDYTLAVMKESLRLRPIGDGVRLSPSGYVIRTATGAEFDTSEMILSVQHEGVHTCKDVWGPNANNFDPDRFLPGKSIPVGYMPFAQRPRDCIGRNLAYLEVHPDAVRADLRGKLL
jgi:cytochrome P450